MVKLNRNDLDFILTQIKIAEAHTAAINGGADPRAALEQLVSSPFFPTASAQSMAHSTTSSRT